VTLSRLAGFRPVAQGVRGRVCWVTCGASWDGAVHVQHRMCDLPGCRPPCGSASGYMCMYTCIYAAVCGSTAEEQFLQIE
jgi:hypothetical protein